MPTVLLPSSYIGVRIERWLRKHYPLLSLSAIHKCIRKGVIRVNGQEVTASYRIAEQDSVEVPTYFSTYTHVPSLSMEVPKAKQWVESHALYEDENLLILDKPAGIATQGGTGIRYHIDGILRAYGTLSNTSFRLVHRLDSETSGVMVIAKALPVAQQLAADFKGQRIKKCYYAVIEGKLPSAAGSITYPLRVLPHGNSTVVDNEHGENAHTRFHVLHRTKHHTALALYPLTGRKHQLRVHCAAIGHPILGDTKYHPASSLHTPLHLHAYSIRLPNTKLWPHGLSFTASLPPFMALFFPGK